LSRVLKNGTNHGVVGTFGKKNVLRIALQRLKRYYDKLHGAGGGTIG
jgi:hypothetical protein